MAGGEWDRRADVFSLAALMHELLWARRVSGTGAGAVENLTEIDGGDLSALRSAFARALAEDPAGRFETAIEFAEALRLAFPSITLASPESIERRASKTSRATVVEPRLPLLDEPALEPKAARPLSQAFGEPRRRSSEPDDLSLSIEGEEERFLDVEVAPAIVDVDARSRTVMWPLVLALIAGLTIGFAGGYGVGMRDRPVVVTTAAAPPLAAPTVPAGREFTESTVAEPATEMARASQPATGDARSAIRDAQSAIRNPQSEIGEGRLLVRSTPSGARVLVDGREYGQTPVAVRNLGPGVHRVQIARDGYATDERNVVITPSRPAESIAVALERPDAASRHVQTTPVPATPGTDEGFTGVLVVDSRPVGASVFMDGQLVGATPLALPAVRAGEHAIRLERDGYRRWSSSVRIIPSERSRVTASLER
jgi:hypothetical protein